MFTIDDIRKRKDDQQMRAQEEIDWQTFLGQHVEIVPCISNQKILYEIIGASYWKTLEHLNEIVEAALPHLALRTPEQIREDLEQEQQELLQQIREASASWNEEDQRIYSMTVPQLRQKLAELQAYNQQKHLSRAELKALALQRQETLHPQPQLPARITAEEIHKAKPELIRQWIHTYGREAVDARLNGGDN